MHSLTPAKTLVLEAPTFEVGQVRCELRKFKPADILP